MKKKIINGLLFAVALVAATSSFVSCKDYNGDNYAELQEKYATLQDAFRVQVQAMQDYVLKTTFNSTVGEINGKIDDINGEIDGINSQTGYSAEELAAKGTIKKRLDDLETYYSTLDGEIDDITDPTKVGSLAYQIAQNNIAIATAQGLAERDSAYLRSLLAGWDNGGTLGDMVTEAAQLLTALKSDTAKYNFAYDTLSTYYQKWNEAVELANQAAEFVGTNVKAQGKEFNNLQDMANAYDNAIADLQDQINALRGDVQNILALVQQQVTGIEIQAVENPLFGTFAYPVGVQNNILAAYFGQFDTPVQFPAGDEGASKSEWVDPNSPAVLTSELKAIGAPFETYAPGIQMVEGAGNAGYLYLTVNPSDVIMEGKEFTLRTSDNQVSKVILSPLAASDKQLKWGYKRAGGNGFYVASAEIKKADVKDVAMSFDMKSIASDVKTVVQTGISASNIAKIALDVRDAMKFDLPRLGVNAQWKDTLGWKNYVSKYEIAAFSVKPLGYDFLYNTDFSPRIVKFADNLIAREKAFAQDLIKEIADVIKIQIGLPESSGDIFVDSNTGKIYLVVNVNTLVTIPSVNFSSTDPAATITIKKGQFYPGLGVVPGPGEKYIPEADTQLTVSQITGSTQQTYTNVNIYRQIDITSLFSAIKDGIEKSIAGIDDKASGIVNKYLNKIINVENKIFSKVISVAKNPNRFIQPALVARGEQLGYFYPSRTHLAPTKVKKGQKIMFYPTTLTGEVVAPAYKKYVAVTGAWKTDNADFSNIISMDDAKQYNTGVMNTVFEGAAYNIDTPFEYTVNAPAGTVLELTFECLGYNGKVAGKKYYIAVYE